MTYISGRCSCVLSSNYKDKKLISVKNTKAVEDGKGGIVWEKLGCAGAVCSGWLELWLTGAENNWKYSGRRLPGSGGRLIVESVAAATPPPLQERRYSTLGSTRTARTNWWWRRRRGMRGHAGATPRPRRRWPCAPRAQALQTLRR